MSELSSATRPKMDWNDRGLIMRWLRFLGFLFVVTVINASNLRDMVSVSSLSAGPDILLIFMVYFAASCSRPDTILVSFLIGFAVDVSSVTMLIGPYTISYCLLGGLLSLFHKGAIRKRMIYQAIAIFGVGIIGGILAELLTFAKSGSMPADTINVVFLTALYSAVVGPFIWKLSASRTHMSLWKNRVF